MSENLKYESRWAVTPADEAIPLEFAVWGWIDTGVGHGYEAEDVADIRAFMQSGEFDADIYIHSLLDEEGFLNTLAELLLACAACCQGAQRAFPEGEERVAWSYVVSAYFYYGEFNRMREVKEARSGSVQVALNARHAENRAMRRDAEDWFRSARLQDATVTKDAAAESIAGKVVPAKFRTVRGWLSKIAE